MKDPRSAKRRRISDQDQPVDSDGDTAMRDEQETTPTPRKQTTGNESLGDSAEGTEEEDGSPSTSRSVRRRRLSKTGQTPGQEGITITQTGAQDVAQQGGKNQADTTPSRRGLRSSGRQRKAPQRFEDEVNNQMPVRRSTTASGQTGTTPRSTRRTRQVLQTEGNARESPRELEEEEDEAKRPARVTRTRSKRNTVRFDDAKEDTRGAVGTGHGSQQSPPVDDYQDGLDDLVSVQLQQDLTHQESHGPDEIPSTILLPTYAEAFRTLSQAGLTNELRTLTSIVLEKLNGKRRIPLKGVENEYRKVEQLLEQTVSVGEGNSMLLLGSRGSGKTAMVETIIASLRKEHQNDFHVVRLNGFLHTDDRLALREMWRQLGRETNTEDEAGKVGSYADTMATLLALLSHPEELFGSPENAETVTAAKSIVIILDEFDLFVTHPRQTLLYNLFDIAQARKAPVAVLGLTTKVDVTEMLEKRVKSRFSHRYVYVPLPRTFDTFSDICFAGLNLEESEVLEAVEGTDAEKDALVKSEGWSRLLEGWKDYLQGLWRDEAFQSHLQRIYHQSKSVKEFLTSALIGLGELHYSTYPDSNNPPSLQIPTAITFSSQSLSCPDPAPLPFSASATASSSSLLLSLLLAATRLAALFDPGLEAGSSFPAGPLALSFPAAYAEYVRLLTAAKTSASVSGAAATPGRVWGRDVAREAWEKLVSWGLISPVGAGSGTADGRMFRVEISFEEVVAMAGSGGSLGKWWRDG
ncbi:origin recognition complex subunit 4 [Aspergillus melleus]|uniref:Origin recognition complex subunit 4 n=1 Tax=Aspergillus melleus TaxID=138277 RepID=A0ACC3API2_9EURO|nr:origin recognition complex subunit 4 [Aspergillus melleus]